MQQFDMELAVGESFQIGNRLFTVIDIDGPEISVRVDHVDDDLAWPHAAPHEPDFPPPK